MQSLNATDFAAYVDELDISPWSRIPYKSDVTRYGSTAYFLPKKAGPQIALCENFHELFGFDSCLFNATYVFSRGSIHRVLDIYLEHFGVEYQFDSALLLTDAERSQCCDLLTLTVLDGWDVIAISPSTKRVVKFDHHIAIQVFTQTPAEVDEIVANLQPWNLATANDAWHLGRGPMP